jgi:hypothetical protein
MSQSPPTFGGYTWMPVQSPLSDGGFTRSESALYGAVSIGSSYSGNLEQIGLAQNIRYEGQTGNTPVNGIGDPWAENKPGMSYLTFTIGNFSIRKRRLMDLFMLLFPNLPTGSIPMDFRTLPFELDLSFRMARPYATNSSGNAQTVEDATEKLFNCWIQTWTAEWSDANSLRLEGVTGWAAGLGMYRNGAAVAYYGNPAGVAVVGTIP